MYAAIKHRTDEILELIDAISQCFQIFLIVVIILNVAATPEIGIAPAMGIFYSGIWYHPRLPITVFLLKRLTESRACSPLLPVRHAGCRFFADPSFHDRF